MYVEHPVFALYSHPERGARWWAQWIYRLACGFASGAQLIDCVPLGQNVDTATLDSLLKGAEAAEWIKREGLAPSVSQRFFGVACVRRELEAEYAPPTWYSYVPGSKFVDAWRFYEGLERKST